MGLLSPPIPPKLRRFIDEQQMFFVATAAAEGRINLSPKGIDSFRVLEGDRVAWLNLTGSGNETAAHLLKTPRITLMFCSFVGDPLILRLYGEGRAVHPGEPDWDELSGHFDDLPGARQVIDIRVTSMQTSCGFAVPEYTYNGQRERLIQWAKKAGPSGMKKYWKDKNQTSIDGLPTGINTD